MKMKSTRTYRANVNKYEKVDKLPANALTVREYCEREGFTNPYVYQLYNKGKIRIVLFKGINFVID